MTKLLLFGAGGQLGQECAARAAAFAVGVIARSRAETDIAEPAQVAEALRDARPAVVLNAAAYTKVDKAESERDEAFRVNTIGAGVVAAACAAADVPLIHVSTDYVFDGEKSSPYVESDRPAPLGVYGASKLAGEEAVRANHKKHLILRTSWVYGRYGANFLKTILKLSGERTELRIVADQRGSPTCTRDLADVILGLAPRLLGEGRWGTFHFCGEGDASWCEFADEILKARQSWAGVRPRLTAIPAAEYPTPAKRPRNSVLDSGLFKATFHLSARPWRQAVKETVDALMKTVPT